MSLSLASAILVTPAPCCQKYHMTAESMVTVGSPSSNEELIPTFQEENRTKRVANCFFVRIRSVFFCLPPSPSSVAKLVSPVT